MVLLLRNEGKFWYEAPCCCFLVDVHCGFRVSSGWLLLFPGGLWMVAVLSGWALDGCCSFRVGSGWLLLFPGGLWMVAVLSGWALDGCCSFRVGSGWLLLFPGFPFFRFPFSGPVPASHPYVRHSHCMQHTGNPPCSPCLMYTAWHRESLKLKENLVRGRASKFVQINPPPGKSSKKHGPNMSVRWTRRSVPNSFGTHTRCPIHSVPTKYGPNGIRWTRPSLGTGSRGGGGQTKEWATRCCCSVPYDHFVTTSLVTIVLRPPKRTARGALSLLSQALPQPLGVPPTQAPAVLRIQAFPMH